MKKIEQSSHDARQKVEDEKKGVVDSAISAASKAKSAIAEKANSANNSLKQKVESAKEESPLRSPGIPDAPQPI